MQALQARQGGKAHESVVYHGLWMDTVTACSMRQ